MSKRPRVLVAEDEAIIAMDLKSTLENWGFNVEATFRTGEELLRFAQADDPEILIMDIFLQGKMDGITAAREVLKTNKIPVIFLTGASDFDPGKLEIGGKYKFLHKPFTKDELKEALKKIYSNHTF
ncbi:MAG TPA: response regulator [Ignavibacteriaceae bacterium]|nr:response regulator [Ignavibacteriaceae bacterium]